MINTSNKKNTFYKLIFYSICLFSTCTNAHLKVTVKRMSEKKTKQSCLISKRIFLYYVAGYRYMWQNEAAAAKDDRSR